jgi:hypothetical protein
MWDLWWTKWHWDSFFPNTSVFSCQFHSTCAPLHGKTKKLIIFIAGLHNKPQGCGASVASAAGPFTTKRKTRWPILYHYECTVLGGPAASIIRADAPFEVPVNSTSLHVATSLTSENFIHGVNTQKTDIGMFTAEKNSDITQLVVGLAVV